MAQLGAMTVIENPTPATSLAGIGGGVSKMNPMESVIGIFEEMRDGINSLADLASKTFDLQSIIARNDALESGNTDSLPDVGGGDDKDKGGMLDSLKDMFEGGIGDKLGLTLMLAGLALLFQFGDEIAAALEPILKDGKIFVDANMPAFKAKLTEVFTVIGDLFTFVTDTFESVFGEGSSIYLGLFAIAALLFPSTLTLLLGVGVGSIKFALGLLSGAFKFMAVFIETDLVTAIGQTYLGQKFTKVLRVLKRAYRKMRVFLKRTLPRKLKAAYGGAKGKLMMGIAKLKRAFRLMKVFIMTKLPAKLKASYGGAKGKLMGGVKKLATAFRLLKVFLVSTMIPAIVGFMTPFIVPLAIIVGVIAAAVLVFHSIKAGIDEFKASLDSGDSMLVAITEGVSTAFLTLVTLPITLFKNFLAWALEKLGFEGIAAKLKDIDIVDSIKDGIKFMFNKAKDFILGIFDIDFKGAFGKVMDIGAALFLRIKAIGSGALAAAKAIVSQIWTGVGPMQAFSDEYSKVIASGKAEEPKDTPGEFMKGEIVTQAQIEADEIAREQQFGNKGSTVVDASQTTTSTSNSSFTTTTLAVDHGDETQAAIGRIVKPGGRSDIRLKEDIKLIGKSPSDINIYEFKYIGEEGKYEGVMAQEVPWASSIADNGFLWVDYTKLDVDFVKLS